MKTKIYRVLAFILGLVALAIGLYSFSLNMNDFSDYATPFSGLIIAYLFLEYAIKGKSMANKILNKY